MWISAGETTLTRRGHVLCFPHRIPRKGDGVVGSNTIVVDVNRGTLGLAQPYEFRRDGWPFCPQCGEDEVYSVKSLSWIEPRRPTLEELAGGGFRCYACDWSIERLVTRAEAVA